MQLRSSTNTYMVTDHKPLEHIFGENRQTPKIASNRLLRWAMTLNSYNFNVIHQPGKENYPADSLSRLPLKEISEELELPNHAKLLHMRVRNSPMKRSHLKRETVNDSTFSNVIRCLQTHWPEKKNLHRDLVPFYEKRTQLSFEEDLLLWKGRICVPLALQPEVLDVMKNIEYEQFVQKQHHDSTAAPDQNFIEGEEVWVNNSSSKGSRTGPLSYLVGIDGILRRKHCDQMRKRKLMINTNEPSHQEMLDEFEDYQSPQLHQSASCNENESSLNEVEAKEGELNNVDHSLSRECVIPRRNPFRIRKPPSRFSE
ncbi:hypothetical protein JTB14_032246 [Gonioctena quinquepunctata]|nr:hypothetical protein JTB14_032246 [Gonioctena quinquepunctata]